MIGRVLSDRYALGEVVGQGGMAVVHRATDRRLGREVALKVLRDQYADDPEFVARFDHEAFAGRDLHRHAARIRAVEIDRHIFLKRRPSRRFFGIDGQRG